MIIKTIWLIAPIWIWSELIVRDTLSVKEKASTLLGFVWFFLVSLILSIVFVNFDLWPKGSAEDVFYFISLGWAIANGIICGALIPLLRHAKLGCLSRVFLQYIVLLVGVYFSGWLLPIDINIAVGLIVILICSGVPALCLSDWTALDANVYGRSFLQSVSWVLLLLWFLPSVIFYFTDDSWNFFLSRDIFKNIIFCFPLIFPAYLISNALYHFAVCGRGTAFPYDPPKFLVISGIYRYGNSE